MLRLAEVDREPNREGRWLIGREYWVSLAALCHQDNPWPFTAVSELSRSQQQDPRSGVGIVLTSSLMHAALISIAILTIVCLLAGSIVAVVELRRAPLGVETEGGFYFDTTSARGDNTVARFAATRMLFLWL